MLFLDGVYVGGVKGSATRLRWVKAPTSDELTQLAHIMARRIGHFLERQQVMERDIENSYLASDSADEDPLHTLMGHSITYRIAVGPQAGRKVFTLYTLPTGDQEDPFGGAVGKVAGFSLHAGVATKAHERTRLERLCRYISRPALSEKRLSLTTNGKVRNQLNTLYHDGTTHVLFEPMDFIVRLAALVPKPRVNLTRLHEVHPCTSPLRGSLRMCKLAILPICHGVLAPNSKHRSGVTPARRGKGKQSKVPDDGHDQTPTERRASMTWAQRLKRVFNIDIETCREYGGTIKVIACIEDPVLMPKALPGAGSQEDPRLR